MEKVKKLQSIIGERKIVNGTRMRTFEDRIEKQDITGMVLMIEGKYLVFSNLGIQIPLTEKVIESITDRKAILTFRDGEGPVKFHLHLW